MKVLRPKRIATGLHCMGLEAFGSIRFWRWAATIASRRGHRGPKLHGEGFKPHRGMARRFNRARPSRLPLTRSTGIVRPATRKPLVFTDVLPPPWRHEESDRTSNRAEIRCAGR